MNREFIKVQRSRFWHLATVDGIRKVCQMETRLDDFSGVLLAVTVRETFPPPMCKKCKKYGGGFTVERNVLLFR